MPRPDRRPDSSSATPRTRSSRWLPALALVALLLIGLVIWRFPVWQAQAQAGTAYGARIGCSCRYVQGRELTSCATDFEPGMEMVSLSESAERQTVTASVPLFASRTARFAGASGCLLE